MCLAIVALISDSCFSFTAMAYSESTFRAFIEDVEGLSPLDELLWQLEPSFYRKHF